GPADSEFGGDPPAEADAAEDHFVESQSVEQFDVVKRHVLDVVDLVEPAGVAEAGVCRDVDGEVFGPGIVERQPAHALAEAGVEVDQRRAVAAVDQDGGSAGNVDRFRLAALARQEDAGGVTELAESVEHRGISLASGGPGSAPRESRTTASAPLGS